MDGVIEDFLSTILIQSTSEFDKVFTDLAEQVMYVEKYIADVLNTNFMTIMYQFIFLFAISLLILKALKKGFFVYIMWRDGDADSSPREMITSMFLAVALATSFPFLYPYLADTTLWLIDQLLKIMFSANVSHEGSLGEDMLNFIMSAGGLFNLLLFAIYVIGLLIFWFQVLRRAIELLILRIGFPIACIGLIDSDGGVFKPYVKLLFQSAFTVVIQVLAFGLSQKLIYNTHLFFAIGAIIVAINAPQLMSSLLASTGGSGNIGSKVQQTVSTINIIKSMSGK